LTRETAGKREGGTVICICTKKDLVTFNLVIASEKEESGRNCPGEGNPSSWGGGKGKEGITYCLIKERKRTLSSPFDLEERGGRGKGLSNAQGRKGEMKSLISTSSH